MLIKSLKTEVTEAVAASRHNQSLEILAKLANNPACTDSDLREATKTMRAIPALKDRVLQLVSSATEFCPLARLQLMVIFGSKADEIHEQLIEIVNGGEKVDNVVDRALACVAYSGNNADAYVALRQFNRQMPAMLRAMGIG